MSRREPARTAAARGDLAERMLPVAAQLACLVHGDGGDRDVHQLLARLAEGEKDALLVVLAGLVPPDVPLGWLLGYLTWDEHGDADKPTATTQTLRDLAEEYQPTQMPVYVDDVAVERALLGQRVPLSRAERREAVVRGLCRGMETGAVADVLGMSEDAVDQAWVRARRRAREAGEPVPHRPGQYSAA